MGGGEGGNLGSRGEAPGGICKSVPPDDLCQPDDVSSEVVEVFPEHNTQCWSHICTTGGYIEG